MSSPNVIEARASGCDNAHSIQMHMVVGRLSFASPAKGGVVIRSVDRFRTVWWVGALAAMSSVPTVTFLRTVPADAQDFCGEGSEGSISSCTGPIVNPASGISGAAQRQI